MSRVPSDIVFSMDCPVQPATFCWWPKLASGTKTPQTCCVYVLLWLFNSTSIVCAVASQRSVGHRSSALYAGICQKKWL